MAKKRRTPLARYIVETREKRGWDRADLSRQSGVPVTTLRNIENNQKNVKPKEETLAKLAAALEVDEEILRLWAGYREPPHLGIDERDEQLLSILRRRPAWEGIREKFLQVPEEKQELVIEYLKLQLDLLENSGAS